MKKFFTLLIFAVLFGGYAMANPVDSIMAKQVGRTFLESHGVKDIEFVNVAKNIGFTNLYIFNGTNNSCFVIVAADDRVQPILGYSEENTFGISNLPANVLFWIMEYENQIVYAITKNSEPSEEITLEWNTLKNGDVIAPKSTRAVGALITTHWDQSPYYNDLCPTSYFGIWQCPTGCVATAMAQVMKYWNYPANGKGWHSYDCNYYGTQSANFSGTTYAWNYMPNQLTDASSATQVNAVATLMYHCGVSVNMDYGRNGSGANPENVSAALKNYFRYDNGIRYVKKNNYTQSNWITLLKTELNAGRPIVYSGGGNSSGHEFVCDGYDNSNYFHFNWGWSGYCDGYYSITNLAPGEGGIGAGNGSYTNNQDAVIGIQPSQQTGPQLVMRQTLQVNDADWGYNITGNLQVLNAGNYDFNGQLAVAILNEEYMALTGQRWYGAMSPDEYADADISISGGTPLVPGSYIAVAVYSEDGNDWDIIPNGQNAYSSVYFNVNSFGQLETNSEFSNTTFVQGETTTINVDVLNVGESTFYGQILLSLTDIEDGSYVQHIQIADITNGLQSNYHYTNGINFTGVINVAPGTYLMELAYQNSGETEWYYVGNNNYDNPVFVTVIEPPTLSVNPGTLSFSQSGGSRLVEILGNVEWTAATSDSWLRISPSFGFGSSQMIITTEANNSDSERSATVAITSGDLSAVIYVTQNGLEDTNADCLVQHQERFVSTDTIYRVSSNGGYVCGSNTYDANQAKAEWFQLSGNYNVKSVDFKYAIDGNNGSVTFKIWDDNLGYPGAELASKTVNLSTLYSAATNDNGTRTGIYTWVLSSPVPISDRFFAGIDVSDVGSNFGLYSTTEGGGYDEAYEFVNGSWDYIESDWNLDISMYILPTVCPSRLRVDPDSIVFESHSETKTVSLFSNTNWTAFCSADWLTISPESGSGNETITVAAEENTSTESRSATIIVSGTNVETKTISVTQAGFVYTLDVDTTPLEYAFSGGSKVINITSNTSWRISTSVDWITISPTTGSNVGSITIIAMPNDDTNSRTAIVSISGENVETKTISITQAGFEYILTVSPQILSFIADGETKTVSVNSTTTWSATSSADWLSVTSTSGSNNGTLIVVANTNTSPQQRTATITVSGENVDSKTIAVVQDGYVYTLEVSSASLDFVAEGETKTVSISSNTTWNVTSSVDWLNVTPTNGSNNGTLIVVATANTSPQQRMATITISGENVDPKTVAVVQDGFVYAFEISPANLDFVSEGETKIVSISSNTIWSATSSADWLSVTPASGSNNGTLIVIAEANASITQRSALILISGEHVETQLVSVVQAGYNYVLEVNPTSLNYIVSGEDKIVTITSNTSWMVTSTANWLTASQTSGSNNASFVAVATENTLPQVRTASIIVSGENVDAQIISVTQDGTTTSICEEMIEELSLFPNPATDILNITSSETISEIEIVNTLGQVVKRIEVNADNAVCDVEDLTSGVYVVRIRTLRQAQGAAMRKFIKE